MRNEAETLSNCGSNIGTVWTLYVIQLLAAETLCDYGTLNFGTSSISTGKALHNSSTACRELHAQRQPRTDVSL